MDEAKEQYSKSLRHALTSFEKAKEWHWSDLIKWLKKVESIVSRSTKSFVPELIPLSKRLAQCLNPILPQGLHSNTLQIYELLLESKANYKGPIDEELIAYSAGLFPFFQHASPQNKTKLLELYQKYFLPYGQHIAFLVSGLVTSVVAGLEDQGAPDTVQSIYLLFDGVAKIDAGLLSSAVWMALLRAPKARAGALVYLAKRRDLEPPDGYLATNALIAGLNDTNVIVQRMTLDLAKTQFPFNSEKIERVHKIGLLEAGLKLLKKQDFTIMRRVWEWTNFAEMNEDQEKNLMDILVPALENIFQITPDSKDTARVPLDVLKIILDQESLEPLVLSRVTVTVVNYLYRTRNIDEVCQYIFRRTLEVLEGSRGQYIWKCLHGFFRDNRSSIVHTLDVIKYTIQTYPLSMSEAHDLSPLLTELLRSMRDGPAEALTPSLELACHLLRKVDEKPQGTGFQDFYVSLCNGSPSIDQLGLGADICIALGEVGLWVQCLNAASQSEDTQMALVGIEKSVKLLGNERYQAFLREEVRIVMLNRLWSLVDSQVGLKCVSLLIAFHKVSKSEFAGFLASSLVSADVSSKVVAIRRFTIFWRIANENWPDQLGVIFEKGEGVFNMLDHLENESPIVRHSAREWLLEALPRFSAVLDPLVAILMHKDVARLPNPSGRLFYAQEYDSRRVLDALRKLRSLLLSGGDDVHRHLSTLLLSSRALETSTCTKAKAYLVLILEITLGFVQGEVQKAHRKTFEIENQSVQSAACEVLELLLRRGDAELGYMAVGRVLETMCHSIREENTVMQLQLLNLLSLIFFDCNIPSIRDKCKDLLMSQRFSTALLEGLHTNDAYLRIHWIDFIENILDLVTGHMSHPQLTHYIGSLLHSLCDIIKQASVKSHLFKGLGAVVQKTLSLPDRYQRGDQLLLETQGRPSLSVKTSSLFDGMLRLLGKDDKKVEESNPFFEVVNMVFQELDTILLTCLSCLKQGEDAVVVTSRGTSEVVGDRRVRDSGMLDIAPLLQPILVQFPSQFLASFLGLWFSSTKADQPHETDIRLSGLIRLLISLQPNPVFLLSGCCDYIRHALKQSSGVDDTRDLLVVHFLSSVLIAFPKPGSASSGVDLTTDEEKDFLRVVSVIFTELESSPRPEMTLWLFDLYRLVVQRLQYKTLTEDKKLRKDFTNYFKHMVDGCIRVCLERTETARYPYPPSVFVLKQGECSLQEAACYVLKAGLYFIATCLYPVESTSRLMVHLEGPVSMLLKALPTKTVPMELISQLLLSLLENSKEYVAKLIKKDVIEFLNSPEFFEAVKTPTSLEHWKQIVSTVSSYCFPKKNDLIADFFDNLPSGVFVSRESEIAHRARALKAVMFLVYSGEKDEYAACKEQITEQLIEFLKIYDVQLLLPVLFAFRVILVTHSQVQIEEIWPRLWPHLFAEVLPLFSKAGNAGRQKVTNKEKLAALKLIELLSVLGLEEFHMYQWIFFYDMMKIRLIPREDSVGATFTPIVVAEFLHHFTHEWPRGSYEGKQAIPITTKLLSRDVSRRRLLITQQKVNGEEELNVKAQELIEGIIIANGERCLPDWESIDGVIKADFLYGGDSSESV